MIQYIVLVFSVIFLSSVKFAFAPALALFTYKLTFVESLIYTTCGGILGLFLYAYVFNKLLRFWHNFRRRFLKNKAKSPKKFKTKALRRMIRIKNSWGLWGIAIFIPFLSLPLATFLAIRFFPRSRPLFILGISVVIWAFILNTSCFFLGKSFLWHPLTTRLKIYVSLDMLRRSSFIAINCWLWA